MRRPLGTHAHTHMHTHTCTHTRTHTHTHTAMLRRWTRSTSYLVICIETCGKLPVDEVTQGPKSSTEVESSYIIDPGDLQQHLEHLWRHKWYIHTGQDGVKYRRVLSKHFKITGQNWGWVLTQKRVLTRNTEAATQ